jgi:histidyl-tRNA synthetase
MKNKNRIVDKEREKYYKENHKDLTAKEMSEELQISRWYVYNQLKVLGLKSKKDYHTKGSPGKGRTRNKPNIPSYCICGRAKMSNTKYCVKCQTEKDWDKNPITDSEKAKLCKQSKLLEYYYRSYRYETM